MQKTRRIGLLAIVVLSMLLTGCLAPSIKLLIDPIEVNQGDEELEVKMRLRLSGFSMDYEITEVKGTIRDAEGKVLHSFSESVKIKFPVAPLITQPRTVKIPLAGADFYDALQDPNLFAKDLKEHFFELQVVLNGTTKTEGKAQIFFK